MTKNKKNKGKTKGRGIRKKKSFLDNQKKHKQNLKRALTDSNLKNDETRFRFENFSTKVSSIEGSLVYQLAGKGNVKVITDQISRIRILKFKNGFEYIFFYIRWMQIQTLVFSQKLLSIGEK